MAGGLHGALFRLPRHEGGAVVSIRHHHQPSAQCGKPFAITPVWPPHPLDLLEPSDSWRLRAAADEDFPVSGWRITGEVIHCAQSPSLGRRDKGIAGIAGEQINMYPGIPLIVRFRGVPPTARISKTKKKKDQARGR